MSHSEFHDSEYHFLNYTIDQYNSGNGPPLISKKSRLIAAATQNDLPTLKELLDSPKWYEVKDKLGLNLLQIAILRENAEIFDYLISLDDFPLEAVNVEGDTALVVALTYYVCVDVEAVNRRGLTALHDSDSCAYHPCIHSRYSYELIKKGADIDKKTSYGNPLLHCALRRRFLSVAQLLLEKGADIDERNRLGTIPLDIFADEEAITMLLCYGADSSIKSVKNLYDGHDSFFNRYLLLDTKCQVVQENLLYLTYDEWYLCKLDANSLLRLAGKKSPLFYQVINLTSEIICTDIHDVYCLLLFSIDLQYLRIFIEKYPYFVKAVLQSYTQFSHITHPGDVTVGPFCLKNLEMLLQSSLCSDVMEFIPKLHSSRFIENLTYDGAKENKQDECISIIYCLLSYGMSLYEQDLDDIYSITGYSEDFKTLLFMDLQKSDENKKITKTIPRLIYDVTLDLHNSVIKNSYIFWKSVDWNQLFAYFAHPIFQDIFFEYHWRTKKCSSGFEEQLPKIPLLQELARDAFRKHFIKVFKIKTAKQFYGLMKLLPISSVHKKIITFETKLYYPKK